MRNGKDMVLLQQAVREETSHTLWKELPSNVASLIFLVITNFN